MYESLILKDFPVVWQGTGVNYSCAKRQAVWPFLTAGLGDHSPEDLSTNLEGLPTGTESKVSAASGLFTFLVLWLLVRQEAQNGRDLEQVSTSRIYMQVRSRNVLLVSPKTHRGWRLGQLSETFPCNPQCSWIFPSLVPSRPIIRSLHSGPCDTHTMVQTIQ